MKQVKIKLPLRTLALAGGLFLSATAFAQSGAVKGQVKDATGEPVMGATISANGKTVGITDMDGNYSVNVAPGTKLTFTYLGMAPQTVTAGDNMVVTLKADEKTLSDVVVIGYGRVKKDDLTGSVTAIKPDELSKGITNNASDMLVGKVAGVDVETSGGAPGAGAQIRIRGGSSLNASNDPLYVIDGLVIDGNTATGTSNILAGINPNDIATFTVLKDASATAIYGSRASNGVIIITTKKGQAGQAPKVNYNANVTVSHTQKRYDVLSGDEYRDLMTKLSGADILKSLGTANTDWQDEIFRTAISTGHNLSISGGLKNMPYRISAGYQYDEGIIKQSDMNRWNSSVNLTPHFFDSHLTFNITAKYTYEKDNWTGNGGVVGAALKMDPTRPVRSDDAIFQQYTGGYWQYTQGTKDFNNKDWAYTTNPNAPGNPVATLGLTNTLAHTNDVSGNIEADYKIHGFEDLHLHANFGGQYTNARQSSYNSIYSRENNYYGWDGITRTYKYSMTGNAYAEYAHVWGIHDFDIMGGAEQSHYHRTGWNAGQGLDWYGSDNKKLATPTAHNAALRDEQAWATHNSIVSYFGRLNYTLAEKYSLTATFRADGSSRFAKGHKWGYFPSAAFMWRISSEKFFKNMPWWNDFKLRLSYGITGQQETGSNISDFYYMPLYVFSNQYAMYQFGEGDNDKGFVSTLRPQPYNPDLTWEKTTTYNVGFDFGFLNNRITASVDGYYRKTKDLLQSVIIPTGTNFAPELWKNMGSLKNYGIEFSLDAKPIVTKDFTWDVSYNVGWNHNEITELAGGGKDYYAWASNTISRGNGTRIQVQKVGEPMNSFFVYQQVYDKDGKPLEGVFVDRNGDGIISEADRYCYKSPAAPVTMGLTTKIVYKNLDFSTSFRASIGNYVYYDNLSNNTYISSTGLNSNDAFQNTTPDAVALGWSGINDATGKQTQHWLSDYFVRNASFLKCQSITLGYTFSHLWGGEAGGRVYATCQNPFIITKYDGLDPEVPGGVDKNPYPRPWSLQVGMSLNF